MAGYVIIGALAAFGLLCAVWLVYGLCCGSSSGRILLLECGDFGVIRRCLWLREMGLLRCPLAVWEPELSMAEEIWLEHHGIEIWKPSRLGEVWETGAKEHGAGAGDTPGRHQCGGVSEL